MKYAFNSASTPHLSFAEMLAAAAKYGYEGLEIRSGVHHRHGIELGMASADSARFRVQAEAAGIALCCLSVSCRYSREEEAAAQIGQTEAYLGLAAALGIPAVRVFCGRIPDGGNLGASTIAIVRALRALGPVARSHNVSLLVETHDDWSDPGLLAGILKEVNDPHIAAVWDVLHTLHDGDADPEQVYAQLGPWIKHVHIHDGVRHASAAHQGHPAYRPIGTGDVDHFRVVKLLLAGGYRGYLSGEWYEWEPHEIHLPREIAALQAAVWRATEGREARSACEFY